MAKFRDMPVVKHIGEERQDHIENEIVVKLLLLVLLVFNKGPSLFVVQHCFALLIVDVLKVFEWPYE